VSNYRNNFTASHWFIFCGGSQDIIKMIIQYLQDEGYSASMVTIQDEANVRINEQVRNCSQFKRIKTAITGTSW
jgi:COMPASS component SWD3